MKKLILIAAGIGLTGLAAQAGPFCGSIGFGLGSCRGGFSIGLGAGAGVPVRSGCVPLVVRTAPLYVAPPPVVYVQPAPVYACPPPPVVVYRHYGDRHHHGHGW